MEDIKFIDVEKELYINYYLYTDVNSVKVLSISEDGNYARVVPVRKESKIDAVFIPGGFVGHTANNKEMFSPENSIIIEDGTPYILTRKKDRKGGYIWGTYNYMSYSMSFNGIDDAEKCLEKMKEFVEGDGETYEFEIREEDGKFIAERFLLTKKTKKRVKHFAIYGNGKMVDHCDWYYDYNF